MATTPLPSLQDQFTALANRVALLDGQGLAAPLQGYTAQTNAKIAGVKSDVQNSVLALEADINNVLIAVQALQTSVNVLLGLAGLPVPPPPLVVPPTT